MNQIVLLHIMSFSLLIKIIQKEMYHTKKKNKEIEVSEIYVFKLEPDYLSILLRLS